MTYKIRSVNPQGQICIGREYQGLQAQVLKGQDGSLVIKFGKFVLDNSDVEVQRKIAKRIIYKRRDVLKRLAE